MTERVVVLGAGPAGLAGACRLATGGGVPPLVLERESQVGGLCRTLRHGDYRFDIGGHRWFTRNEEVDAWVKGLMGDEFLTVDRVSRIYFRGRYYAYPLSARNVLASLGLVEAARAFLSYLAAQVPPRTPARTMEAAFTRQFGERLYQMFFKSYSAKVWGRDARALSADWVGQRTKGLSFWTAARALLGDGRRVVSLALKFSYPRTGYGRISERMAEELGRLGGEVRLGTRVVGIILEKGRVAGLRTVGPDGTTRRANAAAIISTLPLPALIRMLETDVPEEVRAAAAGLTFRHLITVTVLLNRPSVSRDTWLYIHDPDIPFARIHEPRNWSPAMAPAGKTSLVVEYFADEGDAVWSESDATLYERTLHYLSGRLGLVRAGEATGGVVFRARNAYPIYTLDYAERMKTVIAYLARIPNLRIAGRGGTFRYDNSDRAIELGIEAARSLLGESLHLEARPADGYIEEKEIRRFEKKLGGQTAGTAARHAATIRG